MGDFGDPGAREAYREGVDSLVRGEPARAVERLEAALRDDSPVEVRLALGKAYLEQSDGAKAGAFLDEILSGERALGTSLRAYVKLLSARARALAGRPAEADAAAAEAARLDPRLGQAAAALRKKLARGEAPAARS